MSFDNLLLEHDGPVAVITISRPKVLNALNRQTLDELRRAMLEVRQAAGVRSVILTGAGEKAFVAGADIGELRGLTPEEAQTYSRSGQHVFDLVEHLGKPVIAAVNGFALGGGCELAMACTLRVAADNARFGQPEVRLGVTPGFAGTVRLPRLIGKGRALDLLLTGRMVDAAEALQMGLVNRVVPPAQLMAEAKALAALLADQPAVAVRTIIEAVHRGVEAGSAEAEYLEATLFGLTFSTEDMREGTLAFLEKRKPLFKGR